MKKILIICAAIILSGCDKSEKELEDEKWESLNQRLVFINKCVETRQNINYAKLIREVDSMILAQDTIIDIEYQKIKEDAN